MVRSSSAFQSIQVSFLKLPQDASRWDLVYDFLRLRRDVFIDKMKWQLFDSSGVEFEQYDVATIPTYVIAHQNKQIIAGGRLIRCDAVIGNYSYMIRDAYLGKISLPPEICHNEPPTDSRSWELSRVISTSKNPAITREILDKTNDYISGLGAQRCLFLTRPAAARRAASYGYDTTTLGDICDDGTGKFVAISCRVKNRSMSDNSDWRVK